MLKFLFYNKSIIFLYMFRGTIVLITRRSKLCYTVSGIITLCRWLSGAYLRTGRPPTDCDDTRCCITQFDRLIMSTTALETCRGI